MKEKIILKTEALENVLLKILTEYGSGIAEYDLIKKLQEMNYLPQVSLTDHLPLFETHFILFHTLHKLKIQLLEEKRGLVEINCMCIKILPYTSGIHGLNNIDSLQAYYLNLENLKNTTATDVKKLLDNFWNKVTYCDQEQAALRVLELEPPVDFATIKQQYRRLAMRHHPDRGGDSECLQQINKAMDILRQYYESA